MTGPLSGPGLGLQLPQYLYPTELNNAPLDSSNNQIALAAGDAIPIPRGDWLIAGGSYCVIEYLDPITGVWTMGPAQSFGDSLKCVSSDGFNVRIANRTGCPVGGLVCNYGAGGYVQASTTISVTGGGGSTWVPIIGGQLAITTVVAGNGGGGYGVAPLVFVPPPPPASTNPNGVGGIQATAFATISSGTVSGVSFTNPGAGYPTAPTITILPNPTDPNISTGITQATIVPTLAGSGSITGVLCTNPGAPLSTPNNITLTVTGAGTQGTVSPIMCQTCVATSIVGGSTVIGYSVSALLTTVGGYPAAAGPATPITGTITNGPQYLVAGAVSIGGTGGLGLWARPRPLQSSLTVGANGTIAAQAGIIYDGGLFFSVPTPIMAFNPILIASVLGTVTGQSTLTLTMGSRPDIITMQPLRA